MDPETLRALRELFDMPRDFANQPASLPTGPSPFAHPAALIPPMDYIARNPSWDQPPPKPAGWQPRGVSWPDTTPQDLYPMVPPVTPAPPPASPGWQPQGAPFPNTQSAGDIWSTTPPGGPAPSSGSTFLDSIARTWDRVKGEWVAGRGIPEASEAYPSQGEPGALPLPSSREPEQVSEVSRRVGPRGATPNVEPPPGSLPTPARRTGGLAGGGGPGVPAPAPTVPRAGEPSGASSAPPGPAPHEGKGGFVERNPDLWRMLSVIGLAMMRPVTPGSNWLGHVGDALGAGLTYQMMTEAAQQQGKNKERELGVREAELGIRGTESRARVRRSEATLPSDIAESQSSATLKATRAKIEAEYGPQEAEARIAAQRAAARARTETPDAQFLREMIKNFTDPLSQRVNWPQVRAAAQARGVAMPPSLSSAERATAQRLLASKGKPGIPAYEAERQRLNDIAISAGKLPEL